MCDISEWLTEPITWTEEQKQIIEDPKPISENDKYFESLNKDDTIDPNFLELILAKVSQHNVEQNVQKAYPIIHEYALQLFANFLLLKQTQGTRKEQKFYRNINLIQFIDILFGYRNAVFPTENKFFIMGSIEINRNMFNRYGGDLTEFISLSSYTYIKCNGKSTRSNNQQDVKQILIIELIKPVDTTGFIITDRRIQFPNYKTMPPEIYNLYSNFYKEKSLVLKNIETSEEKQRIEILENGQIFDKLLYKKRLVFTCDTLLLETNHRAKEGNKFSYLFILRIGSNLWNPSKNFEEIFIDVIEKRICFLGQKQKLNYISDIHFLYFEKKNTCCGCSHDEIFPIEGHPNGGIQIYFSDLNPYTNLKDPDKLQVIAYPGSCCSVPTDYTCNRYIQYNMWNILNPFRNNNRICADNLMIATVDGVMSVNEYFKCNNLINKNNTVINSQTQSSTKKKIRSCCML